MKRCLTPLGASLLLLSLAAAPRPVNHELSTVESAAEVVRSFSAMPLKSIPRGLVHDAAGVAVIPHVVKAGLLISERFGRGMILVHEPGGRWSNPVFVTLSSTGIGGQVGVEKTDLVLVFKTRKSLDRALNGKLTLGADATIAAGPVGRDAEAASDRFAKTEIFSWSRSRGLFAGVSLEGGRLQLDGHANDDFYGLRGCRPVDALACRKPMHPTVENLKEQLLQLAAPPVPMPGGPPFPGR